jgi:hypothetical protein
VFRSSRFTAFFAVLIITALAARADARRATKAVGKRALVAKTSAKTSGKAANKTAKPASKAATKAGTKSTTPASKPVAADPRPAEARKACAAGKVERGIQILAEIIVENGDANAVYNQARCYQQNGRPEQAVARFREYLRTAAELAPADRTQVEGYIVELEAEIETKARRAALPTPTPTTTASAEPVPPPAESVATPAPVQPMVQAIAQPTAEPAPPSGGETAGQALAGDSGSATPAAPPSLRRTAAIAAASVGVASIAAGAYFGWKTAQVTREIEDNRGPIQFAELERMMARGRQNAGLQWAGYGVGVAALAAAAALVYWDSGAGPSREIAAGSSDAKRRGQFIILPTVQPTATGGVASGAVVQSTF